MDFCTDVYSVGVVAFEIATGYHPFEASTEKAMVEKIRSGESAKFPPYITDDMKEIISLMMNFDPKKRPTSKQIIECEAVGNLIWIYDDTANAKTLTEDKLFKVRQEINSQALMKLPKTEIFKKLTDALKDVRYTLTGKASNVTEKMRETAILLSIDSGQVILSTVKGVDDVGYALPSGIVNELTLIIIIIPIEHITLNMVEQIINIVNQGSVEQIQKMFDMGVIQCMAKSLINRDRDIKFAIIQTLINIIEKGWSQILQQETQSQQQQQQTQQTYTFSKIQQILLLPHPYLKALEQGRIIISVINNVIQNDDVDKECKDRAKFLLNLLYPEGSKLPLECQSKLIEEYCIKAKSDERDVRKEGLNSLIQVSVNFDNHKLINQFGGLETSIGYAKDRSEGKVLDEKTFRYSLLILLNMFVFGSQKTQQSIKQVITEDVLHRIYGNEAKMVISAYQYTDRMKDLVRIRRCCERNRKEGNIDLIRLGLMPLLNEEIEVTTQEDKEEGEGKLIIIGEIVELLVRDNIEASRLIYDETEFVTQQLALLDSLPIEKMKQYHLSPLFWITSILPYQQKQQLYERGIIQQMMKQLESEDNQIRWKSGRIIRYIIEGGLDTAKLGECNQYYQPLSEDGTIKKLTQILEDEEDWQSHRELAQIIARLFKATKLPSSFGRDVINVIKKLPTDFRGLSLLAELPENHALILQNGFEKQLFKDEIFTLEFLTVTLHILRLGSEQNKKKISKDVVDKVKELSDDKYWGDDIKIKAREALKMINEIIELESMLQ